MESKKMNSFILLYGAFIIYSGTTICAKFASQQKRIPQLLFFLGLEIVCLGIYALVWQRVLKRFSLITAMANKGVVVILNLIWSVALFKERVTLYNILGAVVIIIGIWVVSTSD